MTRELGLPLAPAADRHARARRQAGLEGEVRSVLRRARQLTGSAPAADPGDGTAARLERAGEALVRLLREGDAGAVATGEVCGLVDEIAGLVERWHEHEMARRLQRVTACGHVLARLRALPTTEALADRVCEELVRYCGFGRVLLSRVDDGVWRPWKLSEADPTIDWFSQWVDSAISLDTLTRETRLLTERRAELVLDTGGPGIHRIVRTGQANSYVVAPIVPAGTVIGFLHADHHPTAQRCDEIDRDVLWTFAEGFGHLYVRAALMERLATQRDRVRSRLTALDHQMAQLADSSIELASYAEAGATLPPSTLSVPPELGPELEALTPREREVLGLMVSGVSNQVIADELHISVGTTKSHVKHILAKLGLVNRAQVVAHFHGVGAGAAE